MGSPLDFWERCPLCRARLRQSPECPRCGLDFGPMLETAGQAEDLARRAVSQLGQGASREGFYDAVLAVQTHVSPLTLKSLALTALARRHFALALGLWRYLREDGSGAEEAEDKG